MVGVAMKDITVTDDTILSLLHLTFLSTSSKELRDSTETNEVVIYVVTSWLCWICNANQTMYTVPLLK